MTSLTLTCAYRALRLRGRQVIQLLDSPFTAWEGDDLHGCRPVLTAVWVRLDALFVRASDAPRHVIETGLDLTGEVQGRLHGRFPSVEGDWLASSTMRSRSQTAEAASCS